MANTEAPGQGTFKVLNPWIENAPQVSVIEDAKEWFVVGRNEEARASQGEDTNVSRLKRVPMPHPLLGSNYLLPCL